MAELPLDQAVPRFKANEDRLDTFVNSATGYTTSGGTSVQSIQQFLASIGSNGIDFVDNAKARFGTGNDLEIYHSGSGSFIKDTGTGDLTIDGSAISIQTASAERISVSASGIDVTGTVEFDGLSGTGSVTITDIADEDNMASNSATKLATQQSIKAYVDTQVATIPTGDITSVVAGTGLTGGGTTGDVTLNVIGGTGITANADNIAIDGTVATLTGTQTFTNKTLTSAVLNTSVSGTAVLDEDDMVSDSATKLATQQSIKAYVDANAGGGGLPTTGGTMTGDILFNDNVKAKYGTSSDLQIYHDGSNSYISDTGTGDVIVKGQYIRLQDEVGTNLLTADGNDAVSLYFGGASKLATTTSGIDVTGKIQVTSTDPEIFLTDTTTGVDHSIDGNSGVGNLFIHVDKNNEGSDPKFIVNVGSTDELIVATETGYVGIGAPTPDNRLHIFDNNSDINMDSTASGQFHIDGNGYGFGIALNGDAANIYTNTANRDLVFGVNETEVARVSTAGIDVTGDINSTKSGGSTLTLENSITSISANELIGGIDFKGNDTSEDGNEVLAFIRAHALDTTPDSYIAFGTLQNNGGVDDVVTERMRLDNYGRLGIGTSAPTAKMHLFTDGIDQSMFSAQADLGVQNRILTLKSPVSDSSSQPFRWQTSNSILWEIDSTESKSMLLNSAGNLGVGTFSPTSKLSVAGDIDLTGDIDLPDNSQIKIGTGDDLLMYQDGTASVIKHNTTGQLFFMGDDIRFVNKANNNAIMYLINDVIQFHGNSKRVDNTHSYFGTGNDLDIYHDGSNSWIREVGTGALFIDSGTSVNLYANGNTHMLQAQAGAGVTAYYAGVGKLATTSSGIDVTGKAGINVSSPSAYLHIKDDTAANDDYDVQIESFRPNLVFEDISGSATDYQIFVDSNVMKFLYGDASTNTKLANEVLEINTSGIDVTGGVTVSSTIEVGSLTPNQDGAIEVGVIALGTPAISSTTDSTSLRNHIIFDNPNGAVGKINTLNSATSYLTSSDYRLKTDVQEMTGSIDRVKALRPVNFEWIVDGTRVDGFLAHEAQEVVPEAVDGEKDAMRDQQYVESEATGDIYTPAVKATYETIQVELTPAVEATYDEDGNELTPAVDATYEEQQQELTPAIDEVIHSTDVVEPDELEEGQLWRETTEKVMATQQVPDYQGIDQSKIVPLLTSALQDAIAKIEALETRLEALEA